jgi:hypothetical protein
MEKENAQVTATACRYLLAALLPRLERGHPGLLAELREGLTADRDAMAANGKLSPEMEATISEALRILRLGSAP